MKLTQRTALAFLLLFVFSFRSKAQIAGTFSVPATFPTIAAAITTLNTMGVAGHVTIYVSAGHTETATAGGYKLFSVAGSGSTAQVVFQKNGTGANPIIYAYSGGISTPASGTQDGVWALVGADYITIDGIDIYDPNTTNPATMEYGYGLYNLDLGNGCQHNTIKNCTITLSSVNTASGNLSIIGGSRGIDIASTSYTSTSGMTYTSNAGTHSYNKIYGNVIYNANTGISLSCNTSTVYPSQQNDIGGTSAITGNTITNFGPGSSGVPAHGIYETGCISINIAYNTITNNNGSGPPILFGTLYGIKCGVLAYDVTALLNNTITLYKGSTNSVGVYGIYNQYSASTGTLQVHNNVFPSTNYSVSTNGYLCMIFNNASSGVCSYHANLFTNINLSGPIDCRIIETPNAYILDAVTISSNTISTVSCTDKNATFEEFFVQASTYSISNNVFDGISFYGSHICLSTAYSNTANVTGNIARNIAATNFTFCSLVHSNEKNVTGNQIYNISSIPSFSAGLRFYGIYTSGGGTGNTSTISANSIYSVNNTCTSTGTINGFPIIGILAAEKTRIFNNKVAGLYSSGSGSVIGIYAGTSGGHTVYNNLVGDLQAATNNNSEGVIGVFLGCNPSSLFYFNSVYLNAASSGTNFGSSALSIGLSGTVTIRNNIIVNTSASTGTALTCALRRPSSVPLTFASNTDNNIYYAGTPSANNVIYLGYNTTYSTLPLYKTFMSTNEANSRTENPPFLSTLGSATNFLAINPAVPTQVEGLASYISSTFSLDYAGITRNTSTPDIGALEGNYTSADVATPSVVSSGFIEPVCNGGGRTFTVNFTDASGVASGSLSPRLYYRVNFTLYSSVQGSLSSGTYSNGVWTFNMSYTANSGDVIHYFMAYQDASPLVNFTMTPTGGGATDVNNVSAPPSPASNFTVSTPPVISISNASVCTGYSYTLNPSGAFTYTYSGGSAVVSPTANTSYSITGTNAAGCVSSNTAVALISVVSSPTISINSGSICSGTSHTFIPGGADTYTITGGSLIVSPSANTFYTVTGTSTLAGCVSAPATATVEVYTTPTVSANSGSICAGNVFTIVPSGVSTFTISGGSTMVSPSTNSFYTVTGTSTAGCISANTATASVTVAPLPTISVNNGTICSGNSFTINPTGASTYTYSDGSAVVSPVTNTFYTISGTSSVGCLSASPATVNIFVNASPTITVNSGSICAGNTFTIVPSDGSLSYTYSGGSAVVSPVSSTLYTTVGTNSLGCVSNSATSNVTVHANPTITVNSGSICSGNSFTIIPGGGASYNISGGASVVSPVSNTVYLVTGTSSVGCVSANTATATVTVAPLPTVSASNGTICSGKSFTINPNGASTYTYSGGSAVVSPVTNTFYTITGTSSVGCLSSNTATVNITVQASPSITVNSGSICSGNSFTIIPSDGSLTYTYSGGSSIVSPVTSTVYTVAGSNTLGCVSNSASANVTVHATPTISVNSGTICAGSVFTINPSGANNYSVQGGIYTVSPSSNSSYTVTGSSLQGCASASTALSSVTVIALPSVSVTNGSVCAGSVFTLNPTGAASYIYSSGSATVSPVNTSTYSVSGLSAEGCASSNTAIATVTVLSLPNLSINGNTLTCANLTQTLTVSGANTYTWMAAGNGSAYVVSPSTNTTYSVLGVAANNCINSAQITIITNSLPVVSISGNATVCSGAAVNLNASGTAITFTWSNGTIGNLATFNPTLSSVITATGTGANGCVNTASQVVFVNSLPPVVANADHNPICIGESVTLFGTGANTYTWTGGVSDNTAFYPSVSNTYTLSGTDANGCKNSSTIQVVVNPLPQISINSLSPDTVCDGDEIVLVASGGNFYSWTSGQQTSSVAVSPALANGYTVTGTDANGCKSQASFVQYVEECTGIAIEKVRSAIKIYPNPNNGVFYIELQDNATNLRMELVNILGENMLTKDLSGINEITLKEKAKGIYFVRIYSGNTLLVAERIVVAE